MRPFVGRAPQGVLGRFAPTGRVVQHAPHELAPRRIRARLHAFAQLGGADGPASLDQLVHCVEQEPLRPFAHRLDGRCPQPIPRRALARADVVLALRFVRELGRQLRVEPVRRGHPVGERLPAAEQSGGGPVQLPSTGGREVVDDGRPVQRVGEAQLGVGPRPPGHDVRGEQALQRRRRIGDACDRADERQRRGPSDDREAHREVPCGPGQHGQPGDEGGGEGTGRGQVAVAVGQPGGLQFGEQGAHVERVAAGVAVQPFRGAPGQWHAERRGKARDLLDGQRADLDARAPTRVQAHAFPAVAVGAGPARHDHEDAVAAQPAHGRQQRLPRRGVRPVEVFDDDRDRPVVLRPPVDQLEARREGCGRFEPVQLRDQAERHVRAQLVGLGAHEGERGGQQVERPVEQRGLPRARLALDPHEPGAARLRVLRTAAERGQLRLATDERRVIRAPHVERR